MPVPFAAVLLTLAVASTVLARFTTPGCWQRNCLVQNDAGTLCLQAAYNGPMKKCTDAVLSLLLDVHINSKIGLSIAYYDELGSFLGPTIWPVPNPLPFTVFVCMTGRRSDTSGGHRTLCRTALHDDDIHHAAAHIRECAVELPQRFVSDGCYTASPESSAAANSIDRPALVHALFVLGGIVTIATLVAWFRKPLKDGWQYVVNGRYSRRILHYARREEHIVRPFDLSQYDRNLGRLGPAVPQNALRVMVSSSSRDNSNVATRRSVQREVPQ
ncbi:hypothetical protein EXIGLDRAFT_71417 [Exidia glandulosa HHB12029]|uniref:Autophagy-related protein 27 n=1 Tax=Exidia glandulosa HHB12029 TaxID=1314781 RepID=A0A165HW43_EXIGL|nr:hypothetical protein EXIGLDRAFT_71417 [Exidia glandulosa HHB12029]